MFWHQGMSTDSNLIQVLAVGHRHGFDYLLHLADDYARARVKLLKQHGTQKRLTEQDYCSPERHNHFKTLKNVRVKVVDVSPKQIEDDSAKKGSAKKKKGSNSPKKKPPVGYHELAKSYVNIVTA